MNRNLSTIMIAAAMFECLGRSGYNNGKNNLQPKDVDVRPKNKPIPKGCKRFYYNKDGECNKPECEVYFDAMKRTNAYNKYKRWMQDKHPNILN